MTAFIRKITAMLIGESGADRVVPATDSAARLTVLASASVAFLAVFALSLAWAAGSLALAWSTSLANTATIRIVAPEESMSAAVDNVLRILQTTPGIASSRVVGQAEKLHLLEPWIGGDFPAASLPLPGIVEVTESGNGPDIGGLLLRLGAEAPGAVWDDHDRWRLPLVNSANQLRWVTWLALGLIGATFLSIITLAAQTALAANIGVIGTLRLVGATDTFIARAFVRRFTIRAAAGAIIGTILCLAILLLLPQASAGSFLPSLRFEGFGWTLPLAVPVVAAAAAFLATRTAALRNLKRLP